MNINQINEQAKQSLKKYFKNAYEMEHSEGLRKELAYYDMMKMIKSDIKEQEERLHELNMLKKVLEHDAKGAYEYIFGKAAEGQEVHHEDVKEMRKKISDYMERNFLYVNGLKQAAMQR